MASTARLIIETLLKGKGLTTLDKQLQKVASRAKTTTNAMNNALGGKRIENNTKSLATNLSAVGNRLGFMAFQWKFMAGAAQQALTSILFMFKEILSTGSAINTQIGQSVAFAASIEGIAGQTDEARKSMSLFHDEIVKFGSGATIFGRGEIADIGKFLQKSFGDVEISKDALLFATQIKQLDPTINNEKLATGLVTLFEATGVDLNAPDRIRQMAKAVDFLTNVSDKSSLNFQSTIASFSKAAPLAKQLGLEATELGVVLQIAGDVLGRNKSSGRAGSSAGTFTNAFLRDLASIADENTKQGKFARNEEFFGPGGFDIFEKDAKGGTVFKTLINDADDTGEDIVTIFKRHFKDLAAADRSAALSKLGLGDNSALIANALIFDKTTEELADMREELQKNNTLQIRAAASVQDTGAQMKRFKAAIDGAKSAFTAGLAPILKELADTISEFTSDKSFNKFLASIGIIIGDTVAPALRRVAKLMKVWINLLKKNKPVLKLVIFGVLGLVAALAGLFILATLAFIITVAGASMVTMGAQAGIAAGGVSALGLAGLSTAVKFVPLLLLIGGIALLVGVLTGVFNDELIPVMAAVGAAAIGLSAAMIIPTKGFKALSTGALKMGNTLAAVGGGTIIANGKFVGLGKTMGKLAGVAKGAALGIKAAFIGLGGLIGSSLISARDFKTNMFSLGSGAKTNLLKGFGGVKKGFLTVIRSLGSKGGLIAIAAVAIILVAVLMKNINESIDKDPFWKSGLADRWELAGFKLKIAWLKTVQAGKKIFADFFLFVFEQMAKLVNEVIVKAGEIIDLITSGDFEKIKEGVVKAIELVAQFQPSSILVEILFADEAKEINAELLKEIKKRIEEFRQGAIAGGGITDSGLSLLTDAIASVLQEAPNSLTADQINKLMEEAFKQFFPNEVAIAPDFSIGGAGGSNVPNFVPDQDFSIPAPELPSFPEGESPLVNPTDNPELFTPEGVQIFGKDEGIDEQATEAKVDNTEATVVNTESTIDLTTATQEEIDAYRLEVEASLTNTTEKVKNTVVTKEANKIANKIAKLTDEQKEQLVRGIKAAKAAGMKLSEFQIALLAQTAADKVNTTVIDVNTEKTKDNTSNIISGSKTIISEIDVSKQHIIEIARNINVLSIQTSFIARVNVMWARLVAEGNRAAGKLASLKVSKSGKFSITDPGISDIDRALINDAMANFASTVTNQVSIDISSLREQLESIQVVLEEANEIATSSAAAVEEAGSTVANAQGLTDAQFNSMFESLILPQGHKTPFVETNEEGIQQIDINFDGEFDIDIKNGALTEDQLNEITRRFGDEIADAIKDALGIEAL